MWELRAADESVVTRAEAAMRTSGTSGRNAPIAVIGLSCRLPQASTPQAFWNLLREGREAITAPPERLGAPAGERNQYWGGYLDGIEDLDRKSTRLNSSHVSISY